MTEVLTEKFDDHPIEAMKRLIQSIRESNYSDIDAMRQFIISYENDDVDDDCSPFFVDYNASDIGFEYWGDLFDKVVEAYDDLGGSHAATCFPETGRIPSPDWADELNTLHAIFQSDDIKYPQSHALYIRQHANELKQADSNREQYQALLKNPVFLTGLTKTYNFEVDEEPAHIPDSWPDLNDEFLYDVLNAVGYKYTYSHQADWSHERKDEVIDDAWYNFNAIAKLETARFGATKYLSEQFGIRHFSRYPTELLTNQFDTCGRVERPYGVVLSAVDDHNGAFSGWSIDSTAAMKLHRQAADSHEVLVAEAESADEFEQRLKHFNAINGDKFKIDFAVIDTHGTRDSITFGYRSHLGSLAIRSQLSDARKIFSPKASVVISGCSTGKENGIAQSLSSQFNTTVVAPPAAVSVGHIAFIKDANGVRLVPNFWKSKGRAVTPVVYKKGSLLGDQKTADYLSRE